MDWKALGSTLNTDSGPLPEVVWGGPVRSGSFLAAELVLAGLGGPEGHCEGGQDLPSSAATPS